MNSWRPHLVAYLCCFIPIICVHLCWWLSTSQGHIHPCLTYGPECHSISATGRVGTAFYLFKLLMLPVAILMMLYWRRVGHWLHSEYTSERKTRVTAIVVLGIVSAAALVMYTLFLGYQDSTLSVLRRAGVAIFFAFGAFAHLFLLSYFELIDAQLTQALKKLKAVCIGLLALGVFHAWLGYTWQGYGNWENSLEWWFALLMMSQFFLVGQHWHRRAVNSSS